MRRLLAILALVPAASAAAQSVVTSPAPDSVAVTVYRDPNRGDQKISLDWLGGVALVSEKRRVRLPPGESELRFEGVTSGLISQSAIVTGLGEAVLEKNRDARLLSPGALLNAYLAQRVILRRTSKATGAVREQDAVIRATGDGVVIQTAEGFEALRCTGLPETLIAPAVPADLSAKPTLSVRVRSPDTIETDVTLSYLTNNFDWQANYVGELSTDGKRLSLFGWLTMANGDDTALIGAAAQAVAGKVNYQRVEVPAAEAPPIRIRCWPQGKTSDLPDYGEGDEIVVTGTRINAMAPPPPPPPPPPAPMAERDSPQTAVMAREERLGDVRLYRIPIAVTVAANSQKQIALLRQPSVKTESVLRLRPPPSGFDGALERVLVSRNTRPEGLGLAIPAGKIALFQRQDGRRILIGEGSVADFALGEKVELKYGSSPAVRARQVERREEDGGGVELTLTNDSAERKLVEIELPLEAVALSGGTLMKRDGQMIWRTTVPANGAATLVWSVQPPSTARGR